MADGNVTVTSAPFGGANYTVPPVVGVLTLNNGRVATFYDQASYDRSLASGATPVTPNPPDTTIVDGKEVSKTADVPPPADTLTTEQTQATPQPPTPPTQPGLQITNDDNGAGWAPTKPGAGAGTTNNAATSVGADDNPGASNTTAQQVINQTFGTATNSRIITQTNVLDQYASYTYSISWYLLSPTQYNTLYTTMKVNTTGWQLLMQSGGIPVGNRNQFFPVDYYMDDLEIDSVVPLHGTNMINSATDLKWKVTEPNGITLIEQLYKAVQSVYKSTTPANPATGEKGSTQAGPPLSLAGAAVTANQTSQTPNYLTAQHCLVIQFYGYDSQGNLVAPATGQTTTTGQLSNTNPKSVIQKYYPCVITDIKFRVANRAIEYSVSAKPLVHFYNASTDRGTIPFAFSLSGQTVAQLLVGNPVSAADIAQFDPGARQSSPTPTASRIPPSAPAVPGSRDALSTSILSGGSVQVTEDGQYSVGYATGA